METQTLTDTKVLNPNFDAANIAVDKEKIDKTEMLSALKMKSQQKWAEILSTSKLAKLVSSNITDRRLYALYMIETYHYTKHNAKNQALVIQNPACTDINYMKYCLKHSLEEVGHEMMAFHDLRAMGFNFASPEDLLAPTAATDVFVAYLYQVSLTGNPFQRLGYSFWAESAYEFIMPVLQIAVKNMQLIPAQMTFFIDHAKIDENHAIDVENILLRMCKTKKDWEAVEQVMITTLVLTGNIMDAVHDRYVAITNENPNWKLL